MLQKHSFTLYKGTKFLLNKPIPISFQPDGLNLWYFNILLIFLFNLQFCFQETPVETPRPQSQIFEFDSAGIFTIYYYVFCVLC